MHCEFRRGQRPNPWKDDDTNNDDDQLWLHSLRMWLDYGKHCFSIVVQNVNLHSTYACGWFPARYEYWTYRHCLGCHDQQNRRTIWTQVSHGQLSIFDTLIKHLAQLSQQINGRYHFGEQAKLESSKHVQQNKTYTFRKVILFDNNKFKFASCLGHHISHTNLK